MDRGQSTAEIEDRRSEVFEFPVPFYDGFYFLDLPVESFGPGIGLFVTKCIAQSLGYLHNLLDCGFFHALKPQLEVGSHLGVRVTSKDGLKLFT